MQRWYEKRFLGLLALVASATLLSISSYSIINDCLLENPNQLAMFAGGLLSAIVAFIQHWAAVTRRGNRLRQETSYKMESLKRAFEHLNTFRANIRNDHDAAAVNEKASMAVSRMLEIISTDMFFPKNVPVSWWLPSPDNPTTLEIDDRWPQDDNTDMTLSIDLVERSDGTYEPKDGEGVAGFSYGKATTYYLPNTRRSRYQALYPSRDGAIKVSRFNGNIWKDSGRTPPLKSLLSVPIIEPAKAHGEASTILGVLCIGNDSRNAFRDEDIWFAWIAGRLMREQLVVARDHATEDQKAM